MSSKSALDMVVTSVNSDPQSCEKYAAELGHGCDAPPRGGSHHPVQRREQAEISSQYRFFGHRLLYLKEACGGVETWQDVPEHFGRFYPSTLELPRGRVTGSAEGEWFARQLESIISAPQEPFRISIRKPSLPRSKVLFVNCLDPVFGHALYKLAAARALVEAAPDQDVVVLISGNFVDYATFAAGAIAVEESLSHLLRPSTNLTDAVLDFAGGYEDYHWAFCNTSRLGPQQIMPSAMSSIQSPKLEGSIVTFIHRDDRTWGPTRGIQVRRVNGVFALLKKAYPSIETAVIGVSSCHNAYVADHLHLATSHQRDFELLMAELSTKSVCVFGVHGSHMLVPSYHARATVELQPLSRLGNAVQAYWPNPAKNIYETLFGYRVLYGGWRLWDISAPSVFRLIDGIVFGLPGLQARFDAHVILGATSDTTCSEY